jgi:NitT/TauT family transport system substrate-binding protein
VECGRTLFSSAHKGWHFIAAFIVIAGCLLYYVTVGKPSQESAGADRASIAIITYPGSVPFQVAQRKGYFREEGLNVELRSFPSGVEGMQLLLKGQVDMALVAEIPLALAALRGERVVAVATVFAGEKDHSIVARRDRGIRVPSDLAGKRIGMTAGTTSEFLLDMVLTNGGLTREAVSAVNLSPGAIVAAMRSGDIDAASTWQPFLGAIRHDLRENASTLEGRDVQGAFSVTLNLVLRRETLDQRPESVARTLRALAQASRHIESHPEDAQRIAAEMTHLDEGLLRDLWPGYRFGLRLEQNLPIALEATSRWAIRRGITRAHEVPNFTEFIDPRELQRLDPGSVSLIR